MSQRQRVVVIGGGISGLASAYFLTRQPDPPSVTVLEAGPVPGGRIATWTLAGTPVDTGPDALLMRSPAAAALVDALGLTPRLRAPAGTGAYLWSRGRLRPLPAGSVFGVPAQLSPLVRSGLIGPLGFVRAGADLVLPRRRLDDDPTIEQVLLPRFGRQVFQRIIEPMLGGVHAGAADRLSLTSAVPEVAALARRHRSLYLAMRDRRVSSAAPAASSAASAASSRSGAVPPPEPPRRAALMTFDGGLRVLVDALTDAIEAAGGRVLTGAAVSGITRDEGGYRVIGPGPAPLEADDLVVTVPAPEAARLVRPVVPDAARILGTIPYVGVATVILAYRRADVPAGLRGTGFLVPPVEGRLLVGSSWLTTKWPHLSNGAGDDGEAEDEVLIRGMVGRDGDQTWAGLDDRELVAAVSGELTEAMGVRGTPTDVLVRRMPGAMPQYTVGHSDRLGALTRALAHSPGLHLTGAAYHGVGIAGCITQAENTAATVAVRRLAGAVR